MTNPAVRDLVWSAPARALTLMDPQFTSAGANHPGLYLHVINGRTGVIAAYVGKSEFTVRERQYEHFECYSKGAYDIRDDRGVLLHAGNRCGRRHGSHDAILIDQLDRTVIYSAPIPAGSGGSQLLEAMEGMLIKALKKRLPREAINMRPGSQLYQAVQHLTLNHAGDPGPQAFFGARTVWDRKSRKIS